MPSAFAPFWRRGIFQLAIGASLLFVVLTTTAMFFYPGGIRTDPTTTGYSFLNNFFSDLGRTRAWSGQANEISFWLFTFGLSIAGGSVGIFFIAFAQFFATNRLDKFLGGLGALFGMVSAGSFIGVALTPADLNSPLHNNLVQVAFRTFFVAVLCYLAPMMRHPSYPKRFTLIFIAFAALLFAYVLLIAFGPPTRTPEGLFVQVTGQKIIAYASIASVILQSWGALSVIPN